MVWWNWIFFTFAFLKRFLFLHQFWMRFLPGAVILVVDFSLSVLYIYPAISFWPAEFMLKDQLLSVWGFPCMLLVASPLLLLIFFLSVKSCLVWLVCALVCFSLRLSCMDILFVPLGLDWLFPFPCWGNFWVKFLQKFSHILSFSLLLLGSL